MNTTAEMTVREIEIIAYNVVLSAFEQKHRKNIDNLKRVWHNIFNLFFKINL